MSTSQFHLFAAALAAHFASMSKGELFRVDLDGDDLWQGYLAAFPEGTNPMFRVCTEHDGSYDRNFVRQLGNVVKIEANGTVTTIWDLPGLPAPYAHVASMLAIIVRSAAINGLFRTKEPKYGYVRTFEKREGEAPIEWFHFNAEMPRHLVVRSPAEVCGEALTTVGVMHRGLTEINPQAVIDVLDLIDQGTLYRGTEFKPALVEFQKIQRLYQATGTVRSITHVHRMRSVLLWSNWKNNALRIRNTAIGTLLTELSEGMELDQAVRRFEAMVAPSNYKRPTALITPHMIETAVTTLRELDLESALVRRHATLADVSINNVLWADNQAQSHMKDGLTDLLMGTVKAQPLLTDKAHEVSIEDFQTGILPLAQSIELFLSNPHQANLMSLTAPVHGDAGSLFKWDNNFAWSYNGNITDSIKERVKAAGGNTNAVLRVSLAWYNKDDLDIHAQCPDGHIYYADKRGILDVDMNVSNPRAGAVENLSWVAPKDGKYTITVDQFTRRESDKLGFTLEVENAGSVTQFSYPRAVTGNIMALTFTVKDRKITDMKVADANISGQGIAQDAWSLETERFARVETVLNSPNHWDGQTIGNKHWFFILEGCKNPEACRGIYNEFLKSELETHRKVFEVLGNKTKVEPADQQLSGVGFSSTKRDSVILRVTSLHNTKLFKVNF